MFRRPGSLVAVVNALALTIATLFAAVWDTGGHGHGAVAATAAHCAVDHEAGGTASSGRAMVGAAASLHEHSCVACKLGRSQATAEPRKAVAGKADRVSTPFAARDGENPRNGESWQYTARGPPRS